MGFNSWSDGSIDLAKLVIMRLLPGKNNQAAADYAYLKATTFWDTIAKEGTSGGGQSWSMDYRATTEAANKGYLDTAWAGWTGKEAYSPPTVIGELFNIVGSASGQLACDTMQALAGDRNVCAIFRKLASCGPMVTAIGDVPALIGTVAGNGPKVFSSLIGGAQEAFDQLGSNPTEIKDFLVNGLAKWIRVEDAQEQFGKVLSALGESLFGDGNLGELLTNIVDGLRQFFKLTPDNILAAIAQATGLSPGGVMTIYGAMEAFWTGGAAGAVDYVNSVLVELGQSVQTAVTGFLRDLPNVLWETSQTLFTVVLDKVKKYVRDLIASLASGGISKAIDVGLGILDIVGTKCGDFADFLAFFGKAVKTAATDPSGGASAVKDFMRQAVEFAIAFVADLLGFGDLPTKIGDLRTKGLAAFTNVVKNFANRVKSPLRRFLGGATDLTPKIKGKGYVRDAAGNLQQVDIVAWVDGEKELWISWNPTAKISDINAVNPPDKAVSVTTAANAMTQAQGAAAKSLASKNLQATVQTVVGAATTAAGGTSSGTGTTNTTAFVLVGGPGGACSAADDGHCFVAETPVATPRGRRPIAELPIGHRVWGRSLDPADYPPEIPLDPALYRVVRLAKRKRGQIVCWIDLLRPLTWFAENNVTEGRPVEINLPEMGVEGSCEVLGIDPCPTIEPGPGCLITGRFHHVSGEILEVNVEGEPGSIRVTRNHAFWAHNELRWKPIGQFVAGDNLSVQSRKRRAMRIKTTDKRLPVYNIEVQNGHCYRVGEQGILVHNTSAAPTQGRTGPVVVYRGDDRDTTDIFARGFTSWAIATGVTPDYCVEEHVQGNSLGNRTTAYIATTKHEDIAKAWGDNVYIIHLSNGIDVDQYFLAVYGRRYYAGPYASEDEILAIDVIAPSQVEAGAPKQPTPQDHDHLGAYINNPSFRRP